MTRSVGYVGLDHHHRAPYLETIEQLDAEVVATADPDGTRPTDVGAMGVADTPWYGSVDDLLANEDVDLLWLTLSNRETPSAIESAVEAGVDVFSEKPAARTAADLIPVADRIRDGDATVGFSYVWRGHPIARELRDRAAAGFFGSARSFALRFVASSLATRPTDHYLYDSAASRGGIVQWLGVHWLDLLPWILNDRIVRANASTSAGTECVDIEDGATVQLELASGAVGSLTTGYYLRDGRYDTAFDVFGESGHCSWDPMGTTFGFEGTTSVALDTDEWVGTPHREVVHEYEPAPGYGGRWGLAFLEQFLDACAGDAEVPADVSDALRVLRVLDAIYESAKRNEWVAVQ
jgi:predicted dehydrogenase